MVALMRRTFGVKAGMEVFLICKIIFFVNTWNFHKFVENLTLFMDDFKLIPYQS